MWIGGGVKRPPQQPTQPQYADYWAPLTHKRHILPHPAQPRHTNHWAPQTRQRHRQEHRPQRPTESSDLTQHAKGRTGDCPGPRKETRTRRNVTQGGAPCVVPSMHCPEWKDRPPDCCCMQHSDIVGGGSSQRHRGTSVTHPQGVGPPKWRGMERAQAGPIPHPPRSPASGSVVSKLYSHVGSRQAIQSLLPDTAGTRAAKTCAVLWQELHTRSLG